MRRLANILTFIGLCLWLQPVCAQTFATYSSLSAAAAGMSPGTFAILNTSGYTSSLLTGPNSGQGILTYTGKAFWDPTNRRVLFYGESHTSYWCYSDWANAINNNQFIQYSDSTNSWSPLPQLGSINVCSDNHAYGWNAFDPATGTYFYRPSYWHGPSPAALGGPYKFSSGVWSTYGNVTFNANGAQTNPSSSIIDWTRAYYDAMEWFPGRGLIVASSQGGLGMQLAQYNGSSWSSISMPDVWTPGGQVFAIYNPVKNIMLFGGGDAGSARHKNLYKLGPTGSAIRLPDPPSSPDNIYIDSRSQSGLMTYDPVSGNFILLTRDSAGTPILYQYDSDSNNWSRLSGVTIPGAIEIGNWATLTAGNLAAAPINTYGLIMFFTGSQQVYLYKNSTNSNTPTNNNTFTTLCVQSGVLKCVGFDSAADIPMGNTASCQYQSMGYQFGIEYPINCENPYHPGTYFTGVPPTIDTATKASGTGSLKFTVPTNAPPGAAGDYFTNFTPVGQGDLYIQWKQRFSPEMFQGYTDLNGHTGPVGGQQAAWKLIIVGGGDIPPCSPNNATSWAYYPKGGCAPSHTYNAWVVQDYNQNQFPLVYRGSFYNPMVDQSAKFSYGTSYQNARPSPYCVNNGPGTCFKEYTNEWLTFQIHIKQGAWSKGYDAGSGPPPMHGDGIMHRDSAIELFAARAGGSMEYVMSFNHIDGWDAYYYQQYDCQLSSGDPTCGGINPALMRQLGKVFLIPNMQHVDGTQATATAYTWYDELIISTKPIGNLPPVPAPATRAR
jgi:hypothetical protein